jgi:hypothetical protein
MSLTSVFGLTGYIRLLDLRDIRSNQHSLRPTIEIMLNYLRFSKIQIMLKRDLCLPKWYKFELSRNAYFKFRACGGAVGDVVAQERI